MEHTVVDLLRDDHGAISGALTYDRERGRFHMFVAKAVVLATGGVGRAYKITSNSWKARAMDTPLRTARAELIDMEFVQFHPTGMVWPPSVRGILVTEGVRGEGGVLKNSEGRRFMFDDIPDNYKPQTASNPEEGWRYTQGDKNARRPPELLTRDHVARCIRREIKEGRGSPHGGVFLDIAWIKERLPGAADHSRRAAEHVPPVQRACRHRHHAGTDGGGADDALRHRRIRVDADTQESSVPGLFAAGECAAGINSANRLGGNSLSEFIVFGKRAGEFAAAHAKARGGAKLNESAANDAMTTALAPFERGGAGENPFKVQHDLQDMMQDLVGIVRVESEMVEALQKLAALGIARPVPASRAIASTTRDGTHASICATCSSCRKPSRDPQSNGARAGAGTSGTTIPISRRSSARSISRSVRTAQAECRCSGGRSPRCRRS